MVYSSLISFFRQMHLQSHKVEKGIELLQYLARGSNPAYREEALLLLGETYSKQSNYIECEEILTLLEKENLNWEARVSVSIIMHIERHK